MNTQPNHDADRQKILDTISKNLAKKVPSKLKESADIFAKLYYANVSLEDLAEVPRESLDASLLGMWEFCLKRTPGKVKIRVYTQKQELNGQPSTKTIIEIINDNMPFIVDSVTGAINSLGYSTHLVIHPVMRIERDKAHQLKEVLPHAHQGTYESLIHCEILGSFSPKKLKELEEEIVRVLRDVRAAVEDWQPMRDKIQAIIRDLKDNPPVVSVEEETEAIAFLEWIEDNHFTFLGFCEYTLKPDQTTIKRSLVPEKGLGILRDLHTQEITRIFKGVEFSPANRRQAIEPDPLLLTKTSEISPVHRRDPMDSITIKHLDSDKNVIGLYQFIGLFTSVAYNRSVWDIPLLRRKVSNILKRSGFSEQWHDGKTLIHILESFPRDELFQASEDWLFETCMHIVQLQNRQRLTLFIREDRFERFFSCLVYIPRERYDSALRNKIQDILEKTLHGTVSNWQTQFGELAFARIHYILNLHKGVPAYDLKSLEDKLVEASLTWGDHLNQALVNVFGEEKGAALFEKYGKGFSGGYQERFTPHEAITDIKEIEKTLEQAHFQASLTKKKSRDARYARLKVYVTDHPISLSHILPILENMNFKVLTEIPFTINLSDNRKVWIHDFEVQTNEELHLELDHFREHFLEGLDLIWQEKLENDAFNRLIVSANLTWQECQLLRVYAKYLRQLQVTFSQTYMEETLANYPRICRLLIQLFTVKFDPASKEDREKAQADILEKIQTHLEDVSVLDEDRILNKFANSITSTLRTNYYQLQNGKQKPYLSIKIDCMAIDEMPLPRPKYEIFVYSTHVEAIHLRGGDVARGGIRWSDRKEDFRTEVLGLMKAQMVKNAVIVPTGSKGGFIVKRPPSNDQPALSFMNEVVFCYKTMMQGLLDLTDNIKGSKIIPPKNVVRWDGDDTYLVVAADKGTATFSDFANQVAKDYDFWLDDAFASGGSSGYDHKKMGITARGAWESVKRHFREMGVNADKEPITVVGIGDMSGDVFGNGMLLSKHLKLVAAFNHLHIFIDPTPDPAESYQERKRLFDLHGSAWTDYNADLISKGGGVFDRKAKSIKITREMKKLFDIQEATLTPSDLIRYLLKASVDLIWFGGIGTFIKASTESNIDVGDRGNDALRVDGIDVRASVIGEGANLGVTQQGRIEYAKNGGCLNTDAIDNSAGVDCSDHEVNIKILFGEAMKDNRLTLKKRDKLLEEMTDDVAQLVLEDNFWQNQIISLAHIQGHHLLDEQARLIRDLESEGLLNRAIENLPDEKEITRRLSEKEGLTRPELAVLLAYAKISLKHQFIQSDLPDLDILQARLFSYFPDRLQKPYHDEILGHPLRREVTMTLFTNSLINRMGITFVHEMRRQLGVKAVDVAKAYVIVRDLCDLITLWRELETMDKLPHSFQTDLMLSINENMRRMTDWFVRYDEGHPDIEKTIDFFKPDFIALRNHLSSFFPPKQQAAYNEKCEEYQKLGLPEPMAERFITLNALVSVPDIILLSKELKMDVKNVAKVYFALGQQLGFEWLRETAISLSGETHWSQGAANTLVEDFYMNQKDLTQSVLSSGKSLDAIFTKEGRIAKSILNSKDIESMIESVMNAPIVDFAMMTVVERRLRILANEG